MITSIFFGRLIIRFDNLVIYFVGNAQTGLSFWTDVNQLMEISPMDLLLLFRDEL